MKDEKIVEVARLDGYLSGMAVLNGKINDYFAGAFLLDFIESETLESALKAHFSENCNIYFSSEKIDISFRQLEVEIQDFIATNVLDSSNKFIDSKLLFDRKKYIAFKVMDLIGFIFSENKGDFSLTRNEYVQKIKAELEDTTSNLTFYCIAYGAGALVLQFSKPS